MMRPTPKTADISIPPLSTRSVRIIRVDDGRREDEDHLAVEEPLEIQVETDGRRHSISVTMRTPGFDEELAAGFLVTEGLLHARHEVEDIRLCGRSVGNGGAKNVVVVQLAPGIRLDLASLQRNFYTTSSCGVCGKSAIEAVAVKGLGRLDAGGGMVRSTTLHVVAASLPQLQSTFRATGGLHASALFNFDGTLIDVAEDVGRHNALDKVIGRAFLENRLPLDETLLLLSGRISFELVQKAVVARIPIVAGVGAPSSLAVELAEQMNVTLVGFLRERRFNIYSGASRVEGFV